MKIGQKLLKTPLKLFKLPIKTKNTIFSGAVEIEKCDLHIMLYGGIKRKINDNRFYFRKNGELSYCRCVYCNKFT